MARTVATLPAGYRSTDYISLGVITRAIPLAFNNTTFAETRKVSVRQRDLRAHDVVCYAIALALYMQSSDREAMRCPPGGNPMAAGPIG